jgi:SpoVK/Ycf46/Vps4 family AAA+-type ATPase
MLSCRGEGEGDNVRRIKTEFFIQMDGAKTSQQDKILVIGTTNRPESLDEAARRRFVRRLYVPLPNDSSRRLFINHLIQQEMKLGFSIILSPNEILEIVKKS